MTEASDRRGSLAATKPVSILGGSTMGSGIVHVLPAAGVGTVLVDVDAPALDRARILVRRSLNGAAERGKLSERPETILSRLNPDDASRRHRGGCALVIEAVPEILDLKRKLLVNLEQHLAHSPVLATNTR